MAKTTTRKAAASTTSLTEVKAEEAKPVKRNNNTMAMEREAKAIAKRAISDQQDSDDKAGTAEQRMIAACIIEVTYLKTQHDAYPSLVDTINSSDAKSKIFADLKSAFLVAVDEEFVKDKTAEEIAAARVAFQKGAVLIRKGVEGGAIFDRLGMDTSHFDSEAGLWRVPVAMLCDPMLGQQTYERTPKTPVFLDRRIYSVWRYLKDDKGEFLLDNNGNKKDTTDNIQASWAQFKLAQTRKDKREVVTVQPFNVNMKAEDHGMSRLVQHGDADVLVRAAYQILFVKDAEKDANGKIIFDWSGFSKEARAAIEAFRMVADECDAAEAMDDAA